MADDLMPPDLAIARGLASRRRAQAALPSSIGRRRGGGCWNRPRRSPPASAPGTRSGTRTLRCRGSSFCGSGRGAGGGGAGVALRPRCRGTASEIEPPVFEPVGEEEAPAGGCSDAPSPEVQKDNPGISHEENVRLAYLLNTYGGPMLSQQKPSTPIIISRSFVPTPAQNPVSSSVSPVLGGFAQSPWSPKDLFCHICGENGHTSIVCVNSPVSPISESGPRCLCCGQKGHTAFHCPAINAKPSPVASPVKTTTSQCSSSKNTSKWSEVIPTVENVGPTETVSVVPTKSVGPST